MYSNKYISINGLFININTIPKNIKTIADIIIYNNNYNNYNNYYIISNGKIISKNTSINQLFTSHISNTHISNTHIIYIDIIERQNGGDVFSDLLNAII